MSTARPRFLIVRLGALGDVVHAVPAAAALRAQFPRARLDWMVDPHYVPLLALVRGLDGIVPVDLRADRRTVLASLRLVRAQRYDAAIDLQGLLKSAVLARAAGAARTIGFPWADLREPVARLLYTHSPDPGLLPHVVHRNLALLRPLGVRERRLMFPIDVPTTPVVADVEARFAPEGFILINPGAAWPNKRWPPARFGEVAAELRERHGVRTAVLWGPGEEGLAAAVVDGSHGAAEMLPPTTIPDVVGVAARARLAISGDTGPLHLAAAVGTPVVGLFGPTRAERNGPWHARDAAVSRTDQCVCLYERRCRRAVPCIDDIHVVDVLPAADRLLVEDRPER